MHFKVLCDKMKDQWGQNLF